jgi:hypothetical protein
MRVLATHKQHGRCTRVCAMQHAAFMRGWQVLVLAGFSHVPPRRASCAAIVPEWMVTPGIDKLYRSCTYLASLTAPLGPSIASWSQAKRWMSAERRKPWCPRGTFSSVDGFDALDYTYATLSVCARIHAEHSKCSG